MPDFLTDALSAVSGAEWDEVPVDIETFVTSPDFLDFPPLSENQYAAIRHGTQVYKLETLIALYGPEKGWHRYNETCNEVLLQWGKGSGKDACSVIMCCYIVYLLMCLKDPAKYWGKPSGDNIDIMNIAVNAQQANRVFFKNLVLRVQQCPWFRGKYHVTQNEINFDKNINVISGHSESESLEGYNVIVVVLDEISGFALESNTGNARAKTGKFIYDMHRGSVDSRFSEVGKVILLSFPRFDGDFISSKYDEVVVEKETILKSHVFKINDDLPDGHPDNELRIEWPEDHIIRYDRPGYYAQKRPTWDVNPTRPIESFKNSFFNNKADALGRFACVPGTSLEDAFIKAPEVLDRVFNKGNGVDQFGVFHHNFTPKLDKEYYVHVDLARVHDRCAVGLAHVEKWVMYESGALNEMQPVVQVDALRYWEPSKERPMDYKEVAEYIFALRRRGFNIKLVTFDRWESNDTMNFLERQGIHTDRLSVDNKTYDDFLTLLYDEGRLSGPQDEKLIKELRELRYMPNGKIDHPRSGYKDLSDATAGAIYNAVKHTQKPQNKQVEIITLKSLQQKMADERAAQQDGVIRAPKHRMPDEIERGLGNVTGQRLQIDNIQIL